MVNDELLRQVIDQYRRHGWTLRRVLLKDPAAAPQAAFDGIVPVRSMIDGLWFSRRSRPDAEAWELRRVSGSPFALIALLADGTPPAECEEILGSVEERMLEAPVQPASH